MDFDLAQIRAFVAAAEERHFGRAAARLFLSQQGLSKRVSRLEQQVGEPLFRRRHNRVELTGTGTRFLPLARDLLAVADATAAELWPAARPLRVDVWGQVQLPLKIVEEAARAIPSFMPRLTMQRSLADSVAALDQDRLDLAFGRPFDLETPIPAGITMEPVGCQPFALAMSSRHPLARATAVTMSELARIGLWWPLDGGQGELVGYLQRLGKDFDIPIRTDGVNLGVDHLVQGLIEDPTRAALCSRDWMPLIDTDLISVVDLRPTPLYLWWALWSRSAAYHPHLTQFMALTRESAARRDRLNLDTDRHWLPDVDSISLLKWRAQMNV